MKKTTMKFETAPVSNTPAAQAASRLQPAKGDAMLKQLVLSASLACCSAAVYGATDALPVKASWAGWTVPVLPASASTELAELSQGGLLSRQAVSLSLGSYELADGQVQRFERWYRTRWTDMHVAWMTPLSASWGLIWGGSTGERGEKYTIRPSVKLGVVFSRTVVHTHRMSGQLSFKATTLLGGRMTEKSCSADFGEIGGGVQSVNCRLAASQLTPAQSLAYLINTPPPDRHMVSVGYRIDF